ncbi:uncharacterized protein LOC128870310 [Anastrepha ludens]|uniref:uncharacterized protein LOC128870310 n=1 Tax=Anastrepha ludens TaxID=28586 RepID=UPI0023AFFAF3|nr:uncharacterized protein LOC128870310 [Anastrepha ludens]
MQIRAVNGRFGGTSHDSHIWNLSGEREYLKTAFENGVSGQRILGDSGYPLEPCLLTPYRNSTEVSVEHFFNQKRSKERSLIERVFGVLKGRFRCLLASRELHYAPEKVVQILKVCCALHNICIMFKVHPPSLEIEPEQVNMVNIENVENLSFGNIARRVRDQIKNDMIATRNSLGLQRVSTERLQEGFSVTCSGTSTESLSFSSSGISTKSLSLKAASKLYYIRLTRTKLPRATYPAHRFIYR